MTERLVERPAGVLLVQLGPEESEKSVAALKAPGPGNREVGEEGDALRLREDRVEIIAVWVPQGERSERAELDHMRRGPPEIAVTGQITQGSVRDHCTPST
jgi:hypothetical protein